MPAKSTKSARIVSTKITLVAKRISKAGVNASISVSGKRIKMNYTSISARRKRIKINYAEHKIQASFFTWCALQSKIYPQLKWAYAICNSAKLTQRQGAWMKAEGKKPGVWDVFIPHPSNGYNGMYIEFKAGKNDLTPEQTAFRNDLQEYYYFRVCRSLYEAVDAVGKYLL
jgi:hypothetical protein